MHSIDYPHGSFSPNYPQLYQANGVPTEPVHRLDLWPPIYLVRILPDRLCRNLRLQLRPGRARLPRHHDRRPHHYPSLLRLSALCPREAVQRERRAKARETPPARHSRWLLHPSLPVLVRLERGIQHPLDHANHRLRFLFRRRFPALQFCP